MRLFPKISCLTLTTGNFFILQSAIDCYLRQTYENKELIILSTGTPAENAAIKESLLPGISFFQAPKENSLTMLQNALVDLSHGDVICYWQEGDYFHSQRLKTQLKTLLCSTNHIATMYTEFVQYFQVTKDCYWCDLLNNYLVDSLMMRKSDFTSFSEHPYGVIAKLLERGKIAAVNKGHEYVRVTYDSNEHNHKEWSLLLHKKSAEELLEKRALLEESFKDMSFASHAIVRSEDILYEIREDVS